VKCSQGEVPCPIAENADSNVTGQNRLFRNGSGSLDRRGTIVIGLDGGGTRTRGVAFGRNGERIAEAESGASNHLVIESRNALASLLDCVEQLLRQCKVSAGAVELVSAGLAGVDLDGEGLAEAQQALRRKGFKNYCVNADIVTAHAGALGGLPGVVAVGGTGSAFFGVTADGRRAKAGGWGPAFGDEGSAFWIGRQVLQAASSAYDGRAEDTLLVQLVCEAFKVNDFSEILHGIYRSNKQASLIASLARTADSAAQAGDAVAWKILEQAGDELARGTSAILRVLNFAPSSSRISWEGAVIRNSTVVRDRFCATLATSFPAALITPPRFDPLYGAYLIGCKSLGWEPRLA